MAFRWRYLDADGNPLDGLGSEYEEEFVDQGEAETWFSDIWPQLREAGVGAVDLLDGDEKVYGPMSLDES